MNVPDGGKPPLAFRRFLVRLGLLVGIVWGSPFTLLGVSHLTRIGYGAAAPVVVIAFAALCHVTGRLVGRFERDTPIQYGVGCSWPYWLVGGLGVLTGFGPSGLLLLVAAIVLFLAGGIGAYRSVGRRAVLIAQGRCIFCEYDLAGLGTSGVCPECGQKFEGVGGIGGAGQLDA